MKDLLLKLVAHVPLFFKELGGLLAGPKSFFAGHFADRDQALKNALLFAVICFSVVFIFEWTILFKDADFWNVFGAGVVVRMVELTLYAVVLLVSWRVVGGRASFVGFLIIYAYYSGVYLLIEGVGETMLVGVLRFFDPVLHKAIVSGAGFNRAGLQKLSELNAQNPASTPSVYIIGAIQIVVMLLTLVWLIAVWGVYRWLNHLSRLRSFVAFVIYMLVSLVVPTVVFFLQQALSPV